MRTCSVAQCGRKSQCRGMCDMHYRRWKKHGDPSMVLPGGVAANTIEVVLSLIDTRGGHRACWPWMGRTSRDGYGVIKFGGRTTGPYRVIYEHVVGPIPDRHEIDHLCRNRACCNPTHLEAVTHAENTRRTAEFRRKVAA